MPDINTGKSAAQKFAEAIQRMFGERPYERENPGYTRSFLSGAPGPVYDEETARSVQDPRTYDIPFNTPAGVVDNDVISQHTPGNKSMFEVLAYLGNRMGSSGEPSRRFVDSGGSVGFANAANDEADRVVGIGDDPREETYGDLRRAIMYAARMMAKERAESGVKKAESERWGGK